MFHKLRHNAQSTFAEIYCYVLGLMQEYQPFRYSYVTFSIAQTKDLNVVSVF